MPGTGEIFGPLNPFFHPIPANGTLSDIFIPLVKQKVYFGGHDKVILMQTIDLMRIEDDTTISPTKRDIGMMSFVLREAGNLLNKMQRGCEVIKSESSFNFCCPVL